LNEENSVSNLIVSHVKPAGRLNFIS